MTRIPRGRIHKGPRADLQHELLAISVLGWELEARIAYNIVESEVKDFWSQTINICETVFETQLDSKTCLLA